MQCLKWILNVFRNHVSKTHKSMVNICTRNGGTETCSTGILLNPVVSTVDHRMKFEPSNKIEYNYDQIGFCLLLFLIEKFNRFSANR